MPIYIFETAAGDVVERYFPMAEAPEIGATVLDDAAGPILRLPSVPAGKDIVRDYRCVGHSLPRISPNDPDPIWPHFTPDGKPTFTSKAQVQEYSARTGRRYQWDQG